MLPSLFSYARFLQEVNRPQQLGGVCRVLTVGKLLAYLYGEGIEDFPCRFDEKVFVVNCGWMQIFDIVMFLCLSNELIETVFFLLINLTLDEAASGHKHVLLLVFFVFKLTK
jgi:hypothetical protein